MSSFVPFRRPVTGEAIPTDCSLRHETKIINDERTVDAAAASDCALGAGLPEHLDRFTHSAARFEV
jgi:hypothetical protein